MKFIHYLEPEATLFDKDPARDVEGRVIIGKADGANNFCMRNFIINVGGHTPKHEHEWEHEIIVHSGKGEIFCKDSWNRVKPGSAAFIPGNETHQIKNTGDEPLVVFCLIPAGYPEL